MSKAVCILSFIDIHNKRQNQEGLMGCINNIKNSVLILNLVFSR